MRLGGQDKALLPLAGHPLLGHAVARLRPQCDALVISANGDPARFATFGLPVIADDPPGFAGPLAGLLAALDFTARHHHGTTHALSVPADTPFAPNDLFTRLWTGSRATGAEIAVAASGGRVHHAVALWPVTIRDALRRALSEGEGSVRRFAARFVAVRVDWEVEPFDPFFNINTPADLQAAETIARQVAWWSPLRM